MALHSGRPAQWAGRLSKELRVYDFLEKLGVAFEHLDRVPGVPQEERDRVDALLDAMICKNIFLRNRKKSQFYLLMLPKGKKFVTGDVTGQLGVSHLSFGETEYMEELLDVTPGSVSVMGLMNDRAGRVQLVIDRQVRQHHHFACHPCINTSSIRVSMEDFFRVILPALGHSPVFVDLPDRKEGSL